MYIPKIKVEISNIEYNNICSIIKFFKERKSMADFLDTSYKFILENYDVIRNKCG